MLPSHFTCLRHRHDTWRPVYHSLAAGLKRNGTNGGLAKLGSSFWYFTMWSASPPGDDDMPYSRKDDAPFVLVRGRNMPAGRGVALVLRARQQRGARGETRAPAAAG